MIKSSTKKPLNTIGNIVILLGAVGSYFIAYAYGYTDSRYSRDYFLTFMIFCICFLSSLILGYILKALSEVVEALEIINNHVVNILETTSSNNDKVSSTSQSNNKNESSSSSSTSSDVKLVKTVDASWICSSCGNENVSANKYCTSCGLKSLKTLSDNQIKYSKS